MKKPSGSRFDRPQAERPNADRPKSDRSPEGFKGARKPRLGPKAGDARPKAGPAAGALATPRAFRRPSPELTIIYGYHAVREALLAGKRQCLDLFATPAAAERLAAEIGGNEVHVHLISPEILDARLGGDSVHQGVLLEARPIEPIDISEIKTQSGLVLVLDQLTDPHNVGAILRTAAAFGVDAIVTTERHSPEFSGVLAKAASGGLEHAPICEVVNLARALEQLGDAGYLRVGLDSEGPASLEQTPLTRPTALVLGAEGKGLRRLTREKCDVLARLDMPGAIKSLNVSNACAVALTLAHAALAKG